MSFINQAVVNIAVRVSLYDYRSLRSVPTQTFTWEVVPATGFPVRPFNSSNLIVPFCAFGATRDCNSVDWA